MPQLDGLRGLAALSVVVSHTFPVPSLREFHVGPSGVRLFFVLSGFLITSILLTAREEVEEKGLKESGALLSFYVRRLLRIFPLYYAVILLSVAIGVTGARDYWPWFATYLTNFRIAWTGDRVWLGPLSVFWSLAVEEQFYLFWPAIVLFAPIRALPALFAAAIMAGPLTRAVMMTTMHGEFTPMYVFPTSCLDSLGLGAALSLLHQGGATADNRPARLSRRVLWAGAAISLFVLSLAFLGGWWKVRRVLWDSGISLIFLYLVDRASSGFKGFGGRLLESRPLVYLGTVSYGFYVYHELVPEVARMVRSRWGIDVGLPSQFGLYRMLYVSAVTLVVCSVSWFVFERPLNRLKDRFKHTRETRSRNVVFTGVTEPQVS